jgi:hypothetical protein
MPSHTVILPLVLIQRRRVASENNQEGTHMSILTKVALAIGGLLFFIIIFVVCLAFIDYLESAHEKTVTHGPRRVP